MDKTLSIAPLLDTLYRSHPSIHFTLEIEVHNGLPFSDNLSPKRPDGSIARSVYRKPTWTGQYTGVLGLVLSEQKRNLVMNLTD